MMKRAIFLLFTIFAFDNSSVLQAMVAIDSGGDDHWSTDWSQQIHTA